MNQRALVSFTSIGEQAWCLRGCPHYINHRRSITKASIEDDIVPKDLSIYEGSRIEARFLHISFRCLTARSDQVNATSIGSKNSYCALVMSCGKERHQDNQPVQVKVLVRDYQVDDLIHVKLPRHLPLSSNKCHRLRHHFQYPFHILKKVGMTTYPLELPWSCNNTPYSIPGYSAKRIEDLPKCDDSSYTN